MNRVEVIRVVRHFCYVLVILKLYNKNNFEDETSLQQALQFCYRNAHVPGYTWPGEQEFWSRLPNAKT